MTELIYVASPVAAPTHAAVRENLARALRWFGWLRQREPDATFVAPWLVPLLTGLEDDSNPKHRARGLRDCLVTVGRCDGMVLVGGRISSGMELEVGSCRGWVADLTDLGEEPPDILFSPIEYGRVAWMARLSKPGQATWAK